MKRKLIIIAAVALLLSGCGRQKAELTVYLTENDPYCAALESYSDETVTLNIETFPSPSQLEAQLNAAESDFPDVVIFNSLQSGVDPLKLARSGALYPLGMADGTSIPAFSECGIVDGERYYEPLDWNILQAYTAQNLIDEYAYDTTDLYAVLHDESERLENSADYSPFSLQFGRTDAMNFMLEISGISLTDGISVTADPEEVREVADFVKLFYDNMEKVGKIGTKYSNNFAGAASHFSFLLENYPFMHNVRYYQSVYPDLLGKEMAFSVFKSADDGITAQVIRYAAVGAQTEHPEKAFRLLEHLQTWQADTNFNKYDQNVPYAPVGKDAYNAMVEQLSEQNGMGPKNPVAPLSENNAKILESIPDYLTGAVIPNPVMGKIIQQSMEPYLLGKEDYAVCYTILYDSLQDYLLN